MEAGARLANLMEEGGIGLSAPAALFGLYLNRAVSRARSCRALCLPRLDASRRRPRCPTWRSSPAASIAPDALPEGTTDGDAPPARRDRRGAGALGRMVSDAGGVLTPPLDGTGRACYRRAPGGTAAMILKAGLRRRAERRDVHVTCCRHPAVGASPSEAKRRRAGSRSDPLHGPCHDFSVLRLPAGTAGRCSEIIDSLHASLFGPERFKRAAYVLRDGVPPDPTLSFVATARRARRRLGAHDADHHRRPAGAAARAPGRRSRHSRGRGPAARWCA